MVRSYSACPTTAINYLEYVNKAIIKGSSKEMRVAGVELNIAGSIALSLEGSSRLLGPQILANYN